MTLIQKSIIKKINILFFAILLTMNITSMKSIGQPNEWEYEKKLSEEDIMSNSPSIAVNNNYVHIVWLNEYFNKSEICYTKSSDNGNNWEKIKKLTNNQSFVTLPQIDVYGSTVHLIWKDDTDGYPEIFYKKSIDNGNTWNNKTKLTFNHTRILDVYDLKIKNEKENVYIIWKDYRTGSSEINIKISEDNGETWKPDKRITHDYKATYSPSIDAENQNIYITWDDWADKVNICFIQSSDNGKNWQTIKPLTNNTKSTKSSIITEKKYIHVTWQEHKNGSINIYYMNSDDNGISWTKEKIMTGTNRTSYSPELIHSGNYLYIFWKEQRDNQYILLYRQSKDNGNNWSEEKIINIKNIIDFSTDTNGLSIHMACQSNNNIIYFKKTETEPLITSISTIFNNSDTDKSIYIYIYGNDSFFNNSKLECILQIKTKDELFKKINTSFNGVYWQSIITQDETMENKNLSIRTKLINPNNETSKWFNIEKKIENNSNNKNYTKGFEINLLFLTIIFLIFVSKNKIKNTKR